MFPDSSNTSLFKNQFNKRLTDLENELYSCQGNGIVRDFGKVIYTLLYLKFITNKDLLCHTWNSVHCYMPAWMGSGFGGERIHVYVWLSPLAVHLTTTTLLISYTPKQNVSDVKKNQFYFKNLTLDMMNEVRVYFMSLS